MPRRGSLSKKRVLEGTAEAIDSNAPELYLGSGLLTSATFSSVFSWFPNVTGTCHSMWLEDYSLLISVTYFRSRRSLSSFWLLASCREFFFECNWLPCRSYFTPCLASWSWLKLTRQISLLKLLQFSLTLQCSILVRDYSEFGVAPSERSLIHPASAAPSGFLPWSVIEAHASSDIWIVPPRGLPAQGFGPGLQHSWLTLNYQDHARRLAFKLKSRLLYWSICLTCCIRTGAIALIAGVKSWCDWDFASRSSTSFLRMSSMIHRDWSHVEPSSSHLISQCSPQARVDSFDSLMFAFKST